MPSLKIDIDLALLKSPDHPLWYPVARLFSGLALDIAQANELPPTTALRQGTLRVGRIAIYDDPPKVYPAPLGEGFYWGRWKSEGDDDGTPGDDWEVFQVVYNSLEDDDLAAYVAGRAAMVPWSLITWGPRIETYTGRK